jgi:hypothetical protein
MIIGASNINSEEIRDLDRFSPEYDITINGGSLINISEQNLLSLYSCGEEIQKSGRVADINVYKHSYNVNNIYQLLVQYLPNKFDQIVYDWSTTKFLLDDDKIFSELNIIKNLIGLNGRLFIDTLGTTEYLMLRLLTKDDKKYYIESRKYDSETKETTTFNITPEIIEKYIKYNSGFIFKFNTQDIYEPDVLLQHMQKDGSIPKEKIEEHLRHNDFHLQNQVRRFREETMRRLNAIFSNQEFIISYEINPPSTFEYPNKPDEPYKKINRFYLIRRIAL